MGVTRKFGIIFSLLLCASSGWAGFEEEGEKKLEVLRQRILTLTEAIPNLQRQSVVVTWKPRGNVLQQESRVEMSGPGLGHYLITQEMARSLLSIDETGRLQLQNKRGTSPVVFKKHPLEDWGVHFKVDGRRSKPDLPALKPALEASVFWFYQLLTGQGIVPSCVLALNKVALQKPEGTVYTDFVIQATETIPGDFESWMDAYVKGQKKFQELTPESLSGHFMTSLLVNLGDAKEDNYRLSKAKELIGIDNDYVFVDELKKSDRIYDDTQEHYMGVRCLFYLWKDLLEAPIAAQTRAYFEQSLKTPTAPILFLAKWLAKLESLDQEYSRLHSQGYLSSFWFEKQAMRYEDFDEHRNMIEKIKGYTSPLFPTLLPQNLIPHLLAKLQKVQELLANTFIITHEQAFKFMNPFTEAYYRHIRMRTLDHPLKGVEAIWDNPPTIEWELQQHPEKEGTEECHEGEPEPSPAWKRGQTIRFKKRRGRDDLQQLLMVKDNIPVTCVAYPQTVRDLTLALLPQCDLGIPLKGVQVKMFEALLPLLSGIHLREGPESWQREELLSDLLREGVCVSALQWLMGAGVSLNAPDVKGRTPLHQAVLAVTQDKSCALAYMHILLHAQDIHVEVLDAQHLTPLSLAMEYDFCEGVEVLIQAGAGIHTHWREAYAFFERQVKNKPSLAQTFTCLMRRNPQLEWRLSFETLLLPQGIGLSVRTASYGSRFLRSGLSSQLVDTKGSLIRQNTYGRRDVAYLKHETRGIISGLYFKKYPELPGLEEAVGRLTRKLIGHGAPFVDLVNLNGEPVLVSQAIEGKSLQDVLKTSPDLLLQLDPQSLSEMILVTMIINPEDGKPDNYILQPLPDDSNHFRLVGIDNDHAFVPAVAREQKEGWLKKHDVVQVKSVLYCLDQMKHQVHPKVRAHFIKQDPSALLKSWLIELRDVNDRFNVLFSQEQGLTFFKKHECFLGIPFQDTMIPHLYQKMLRMQQLLEENEAMTHLDLLIKLEPQLGKRYQYALERPLSVLGRFEEVDGLFYSKAMAGHHLTKVGTQSLLKSMAIVTKKGMLQEIRAGRAYSPHIGLQHLEKLAKEKTEEIIARTIAENLGITQTLSDLLLPEKQEKLIAQLDFKTMSTQKQQGVIRWLQSQPETMRNWRTMSLPYSSQLNEAGLNKIEMSNLTSLDLRGCNRLNDLILNLLAQKCPSLEKLNLSENGELRALSPGLFDTVYIFKALKNLNLNQCPKLRTITLQVPQLILLELQGCASLERLNITAPQLQKLDLRHNKNLTDKALDVLINTTSSLTTLCLEGCEKVLAKTAYAQNPYVFAQAPSKIKETIWRLATNDITLKSLYLKFDDLNAAGGVAIAGALATNTTLESLYLGGDDLNAAGEMAIAEALATNTTLKKLYLVGHHLNAAAGVAIAEALATNTTLTHLDLGYNNLNEAGGVAIAKALEKNTTFKELNLKYNDLNAAAGVAIAKALATNTTLTHLDLGYNNLNEAGGVAIAKALEKNTTLTSLDLGYNNLNAAAGVAIAKALEKNTTLTSLNLGGNKLNEAGGVAIAKALENNTTLTYLVQ